MKDMETLVEENAQLGGHANLKQKIRIHARVKDENNSLKNEVCTFFLLF